MSTTKAKKDEATIQHVPGGYHLVTYGEWQVSVMNDGMISLPRIVRPQDIDDFISAMLAAKEVALKQQAENEANSESMPKPGERTQYRRTKASSQPRREQNAARAKLDHAARQGGVRNAHKSELSKPTDEES